jgi:hypothetical protein
MLPDAFSTEYALTWEAALAGTGGYVLLASEVDDAMIDAPPLVQSALPGRKYVIAWDIGSRHDHSVGIVHQAFARSSLTVIEANSMGAAVADNVNIPQRQLRRFTTSKTSKERIIEALRLRLQNQQLRFQPSLKQLESELREYQLPDTNCIQDSVMALAIALDFAAEAQAFMAQGRIDVRLFRALNAPAGVPANLPGVGREFFLNRTVKGSIPAPSSRTCKLIRNKKRRMRGFCRAL